MVKRLKRVRRNQVNSKKRVKSNALTPEIIERLRSMPFLPNGKPNPLYRPPAISSPMNSPLNSLQLNPAENQYLQSKHDMYQNVKGEYINKKSISEKFDKDIKNMKDDIKNLDKEIKKKGREAELDKEKIKELEIKKNLDAELNTVKQKAELDRLKLSNKSIQDEISRIEAENKNNQYYHEFNDLKKKGEQLSARLKVLKEEKTKADNIDAYAVEKQRQENAVLERAVKQKEELNKLSLDNTELSAQKKALNDFKPAQDVMNSLAQDAYDKEILQAQIDDNKAAQNRLISIHKEARDISLDTEKLRLELNALLETCPDEDLKAQLLEEMKKLGVSKVEAKKIKKDMENREKMENDVRNTQKAVEKLDMSNTINRDILNAQKKEKSDNDIQSEIKNLEIEKIKKESAKDELNQELKQRKRDLNRISKIKENIALIDTKNEITKEMLNGQEFQNLSSDLTEALTELEKKQQKSELDSIEIKEKKNYLKNLIKRRVQTENDISESKLKNDALFNEIAESIEVTRQQYHEAEGNLELQKKLGDKLGQLGIAQAANNELLQNTYNTAMLINTVRNSDPMASSNAIQNAITACISANKIYQKTGQAVNTLYENIQNENREEVRRWNDNVNYINAFKQKFDSMDNIDKINTQEALADVYLIDNVLKKTNFNAAIDIPFEDLDSIVNYIESKKSEFPE